MFDMFGVFRGEAQDMHNQTASGHLSPSRKAAKTDINATAAAGAAGGLGALAVANPDFFKQICENLKERTGGRFDIPLIVAALVIANAARSTVPAMMTVVFDQVKTNVSSSITVGYSEFQLYNGLLRLAREKVTQNDKAWYNFSGQHELIVDGQTQHLPGSSQTAFKHNGMIFMLEQNGVTTTKMVANATHTDVVPVQDQSLSSLTVRCFGHSNAPILELFEDVEQMVINGTQLGVTKMVAGSADATTQRSKRLLSTIDLKPELKAKITRDAEIFFSEDSREFYASIGQPYRRGDLLYWPPGTGKTSISVALSSHFNVPLVLLTLKGMSDKDLTDAFSRLPSTCIALIEDVDCAGAEVENRDAKSKGKGKGKGKAESSSDPAVALEAAQLEMEQRLSAQQAAAQHQTTQQLDSLKEILGDELGIDMDNYQPIERRTGKPKKPKVTSPAPTNPNAKVSLSCLLNQIDGAAAAEGRLLILTTNCPEVLDAALLRAGRIDEKFKIDFATKVTAELTFKRIFGLDKLNKFKPTTIDRFAQAFAAQFPSRSKICTAELAKYCGQYRGRPQAAIEEFADWLKLGDDMFAYRREELAAVAAEGDLTSPKHLTRLFSRSTLMTSPRMTLPLLLRRYQ
jgi:chaperone BCS1